MADEVTTRADILERSRTAADAFDEALAALTDAQITAQAVEGGWSARDVLAHLAANHRWMVGQLEAAAEGRVPTAMECFGTDEAPDPALDLATQDGRNAAQFERNRSRALDEIRQALVDYRARLFGLIDAMPESAFEQSYTLAPNLHVGQLRRAGEGEFGFPLWQWLRGETWHHYEDHVEDVRAAATRRPA
jgi:hypothetical protein